MKTQQIINLDGEQAIVLTTDGNGGGSMTVIGTCGTLREACPDCGKADCEWDCPAQADRQDSEREEEKEQRLLFNAAVNGVESFLLALACAGVDVQGPPFKQALQVVLDKIGNHYS